MTEDDETETFNVVQFFADGSSETLPDLRGPQAAVQAAKRWCSSVGARIGNTRRVIITDSGDYINFEWKFGEGVTYPTPEMRRSAQ